MRNSITWGAAAAVALLFGNLAGAGADAGRAPRERAGEAWAPLVTPGFRSVLHGADGAELTVVTSDVRTEGELRLAQLVLTTGASAAMFEVAVGPRGVWIAGGTAAWFRSALEGGPPLFALTPAPSGDPRHGSYVTVDRGGTVCAGWSAGARACDDDGDCSYALCLAPHRGLVAVTGAVAPGGGDFRVEEPACVGAGDRFDATWSDAAAVTACGAPGCRRVELASGRWSVVPRPATPPATELAAPAMIQGEGATTLLCDGGGCAELGVAAARVVAGAFSPDRRTAVLATAPDETSLPELVTVDVASGRPRVAEAFDGDVEVTGLRFVDGRVLVRVTACDGTCEHEHVYEPRRLRWLAAVGGDQPIVARDAAPVRVRGHVFAFLDAAGTSLVVQDLRRGKVVRRIALDAHAPAAATAALVPVGRDLAVVYSPLVDAAGHGGAVVLRRGRLAGVATPPRCRAPQADAD